MTRADWKQILEIPVPLLTVFAILGGAIAGTGGAAATAYGIAYSIHEKALAEVRSVVKEAVDREERSRTRDLDRKVNREDLLAALQQEAEKRDRQYLELLGQLQRIRAEIGR